MSIQKRLGILTEASGGKPKTRRMDGTSMVETLSHVHVTMVKFSGNTEKGERHFSVDVSMKDAVITPKPHDILKEVNGRKVKTRGQFTDEKGAQGDKRSEANLAR